MPADPRQLPPDHPPIELAQRPEGVELRVKVVPGASRDRIAGVWNGALRVSVAAPPEGGKANAAVVKLLAAALGLRRGDVEIVSGHSQPLKRVRLAGGELASIRDRLTAVLRALD